MRGLFWGLTPLVACGGGGLTATDPDTDAGIDRGFADTLAPLIEPSGLCPDFDGATAQSFSSGGELRQLLIVKPEELRDGASLVFAWHGAGDSASNFAAAIDAKGFADKTGSVVIVPSAAPSATLLPWSGGADQTLFDDLRTCASRQLAVDLERVYTFGFSAGALWSAELTTTRGDALATSLLLSGGLLVPYETPPAPIPVLLAEGGESDVVAVVRFKETTEQLAEELSADGHFVVVCSHTGGHTPPPGFRDLMADWMMAHTYGRSSPFEDGLDGLPEICRVWE